MADQALTAIHLVGWEIKVRLEKADKATKDAENHYISAGKLLRQARIDILRRNDITWSAFCVEHCHVSQRRANDYIRMVEGKTSLAEMRAANAKQMRSARAKERSETRVSSGQTSHKNASPKQLLAVANDAFTSLPPSWQQRFLDKHGLLRAAPLSLAA